MLHTFHHHPDGRIIIRADDQYYTDTLENFAADYAPLIQVCQIASRNFGMLRTVQHIT